MRRAPLLLVAVAGCAGTDASLGLDLSIQVREAQLVRAPLPEPGAGPAVTFVDVRSSSVEPGDGAQPLGGRASGSARTIRLGARGEAGHWLFPVELPDPAVAGELDFTARVDFSRALAAGPLVLELQATDAAGSSGPRVPVPLTVLPVIPDGDLVVSLEWDANTDVDLLVKDPDGVVLGPKNLSAYQRPRPPLPADPPDAWRGYGFLDVDSNAGCAIDGRRRENAIWKVAPPVGTYQVRVDLSAPCDQARTSFRVVVRSRGQRLTFAEGFLYPIDARVRGEEPDGTRGVLACEFSLP